MASWRTQWHCQIVSQRVYQLVELSVGQQTQTMPHQLNEEALLALHTNTEAGLRCLAYSVTINTTGLFYVLKCHLWSAFLSAYSITASFFRVIHSLLSCFSHWGCSRQRTLFSFLRNIKKVKVKLIKNQTINYVNSIIIELNPIKHTIRLIWQFVAGRRQETRVSAIIACFILIQLLFHRKKGWF